jgi:hypothetical protein
MVATLLAPLALVGCSSMDINTGSDPTANFAALRTYDWMERPAAAQQDPRLMDPRFDRHIRDEVDRVLKGKGFKTGGPADADFLVGYHLGITSSLEVLRMNEQYGYTPGLGWHGYLDGGKKFGWGAGGVPDSYVRKFNRGSLVIDVVSPGSTNLLWRGSAEAEIHEKRSIDLQLQRVEEAVRKVLKSFPPKQAR